MAAFPFAVSQFGYRRRWSAFYGEEKAIREASTSNGVDVGAVLVVAAIAIPNLLRSKIAAN